MTQAPPSLGYAERPPLRRRRAFRRLLLSGFLLGLAICLWLFGPALWLQVRLWYWVDECRTYVAADEVVCEEAPSWAGNTPAFLAAAPTPAALVELESLAGVRWPLPQGPTLYMHERTTAGGVRRLVVVRRVPPGMRISWDAPLAMAVTFWRQKQFPFADVAHASRLDPDLFPQAFQADQSTPSLRIWAGQSDPADGSKFSIRYETVDRQGMLHGQLRDDAKPGEEPYIEWRLD